MRNLKSIFSLEGYVRTLSEHDLAGLQRLRLFKITSLFGFLVFSSLLCQLSMVAAGRERFLILISTLFTTLFANYFALPFHKNAKFAFSFLLLLSYTMLHICTYGQGGVRNSGLFYLASLIFIAYLMLGKFGGRLMSVLSLVHVIYFFIVGQTTNWIDYSLIGVDPMLIDLDFLITGCLSISLVAALANFIEKSKGAIINDIIEKKNELAAKNEKLEQSEDALSKINQQYARKNAELQQKNQELEQFNYVATHDLQEPLRTTATFVELLQEEYQSKLDGNGRKYLEYIAQASGRMQVLIKDLIDYANIGISSEARLIDSTALVNDVVFGMKQQIAESNASVTVEPLPKISGCESDIRLLFQSLLFNSIKFRRPGIDPLISVQANRRGEHWQFEVRDNGIGIAKDHAERIFSIFQRLHTRSQYQGSGIGLSHCKKIIELHKGEIWLDSIPGVGSSFFFTLPVAVATALNEDCILQRH